MNPFLLLLLNAALPPLVSQPLPGPAHTPPPTVLVRAGQPAAVLLVPDSPAYAALADGVAGHLRQALGVALPRAKESDYKADGRTLVVYGNLFSGPLTRRLYANHLIGSDGVHPVRGYELRTASNALDLGANVLFLGGATPEAVLQAAADFAQRVRPAAEVALPPLNLWREAGPPPPAPPSDADIQKAVADLRAMLGSFRDQKLADGIRRLDLAAQGYWLTGDDAFGRLYAALLAPCVEFYQSHREPPTFQLPELVISLDQIDESAGMTPGDRLRGAEWLRLFVEDTMAYWEMSAPKRKYAAQQRGPIWNHETHPALGIAHASQFLRPRYRLPACDYWDAVVDWLFGSQATGDQPLEDSANYQWLVHHHLALYVMVTGRQPEFFTGGAFRRHLDYAIASHDSLGDEATHGDAWQAFGSIAGPSFALGAAVYQDPRYGFLLDLVGRPSNAGLWQWAGPTPAAAPADHVGLRLFTVDPERAAAYGITGIAPERVLDKVALRSGWDKNAEYLMLDGLNVGNHKHLDAGAIIRWRARRRLWLVDMDYIRAAPRHHNSIVVSRDGYAPDQRPASRLDAQVIAAPPFAAELLASAAAPGLALVSSKLSDYAGLDWTRNLLWAEGNALVVLDELTARQAGRYRTRCVWRTLGQVSQAPGLVRVTQAGEHRRGNRFMRVVEDQGRPVVELIHPDARLVFQVPLTTGKHGVSVIARGIDGGSDSLWLQCGDLPRQAHHLPTADYGPSAGDWQRLTPTNSLDIAQPGTYPVAITLRESPGVKIEALILTDPAGNKVRYGAVDAASSQIELVDEPPQHLLLADAVGCRTTLSDQFDYGHGAPDGYFEGYPYADKVTRVIGQIQDRTLPPGGTIRYANLLAVTGGAMPPSRALRRVSERVFVSDGPEPLLAALGAVQTAGMRAEADLLLLTPRGLLACGAKSVVLGDARWQAAAPQTLAVTFGRGDGLGAVTPAAVRKLLADLFGQATAATVAGPGQPGPSRKVERTVDRPAPVTALAAAAGQTLVGQADGQVALLAADGTARWESKAGAPVRGVAAIRRKGGAAWAVGTAAGDVVLLGGDGRERWRYRAERYHGRPGAVATIFGADLDGDGQEEVVAGCENWHYHALSATGKLLWRTECVHASTVGCAGDLTGDGKDEIVAGTEYYWPKLLSPTGAILRNLSGGPVTSAVAAADLDGDGKREALIGMEDCYVRAWKPDGQLWEANVGGTPMAMVAVPGGVAVASDSGVAILDGKGERRSFVHLPLGAGGLAALGEELVAVSDDAAAYALGPDGTVHGWWPLPARPTHVTATGDGRLAIAAGTHVVWLRTP